MTATNPVTFKPASHQFSLRLPPAVGRVVQKAAEHLGCSSSRVLADLVLPFAENLGSADLADAVTAARKAREVGELLEQPRQRAALAFGAMRTVMLAPSRNARAILRKQIEAGPADERQLMTFARVATDHESLNWVLERAALGVVRSQLEPEACDRFRAVVRARRGVLDAA